MLGRIDMLLKPLGLGWRHVRCVWSAKEVSNLFSIVRFLAWAFAFRVPIKFAICLVSRKSLQGTIQQTKDGRLVLKVAWFGIGNCRLVFCFWKKRKTDMTNTPPNMD